jgi:hypothetical protein
MLPEAAVVECIGNDEQTVLPDRVRTKRAVARRCGPVNTDARLDPVPVLVDQGDEGNRSAASLCCQPGQVVECLGRIGIRASTPVDAARAVRVGRKSSRVLARPREPMRTASTAPERWPLPEIPGRME